MFGSQLIFVFNYLFVYFSFHLVLYLFSTGILLLEYVIKSVR